MEVIISKNASNFKLKFFFQEMIHFLPDAFSGWVVTPSCSALMCNVLRIILRWMLYPLYSSIHSVAFIQSNKIKINALDQANCAEAELKLLKPDSAKMKDEWEE